MEEEDSMKAVASTNSLADWAAEDGINGPMRSYASLPETTIASSRALDLTPAGSRIKAIATSLLGEASPGGGSSQLSPSLELSPVSRRRSLKKSLLDGRLPIDESKRPVEAKWVLKKRAHAVNSVRAKDIAVGVELTPLASKHVSLGKALDEAAFPDSCLCRAFCTGRILPLLCLFLGLGIGVPLGLCVGILMGSGVIEAPRPSGPSLQASFGSLDQTAMGKTAGAAAAAGGMAIPRVRPLLSTAQGGLRGRSVGSSAAGAMSQAAAAMAAEDAMPTRRSEVFRNRVPHLRSYGSPAVPGDLPATVVEPPGAAVMEAAGSKASLGRSEKSTRLASKREQLIGRRDAIKRAAATAAWLNDPWPSYMKSVAQDRMDSNSTDLKNKPLPVPHLIDVQA